MRAMAIEEFGGSEKLKPMDLPVPEITDHEVLIAVKAAGVNPVDWKVRDGLLRERLPHAFPLIPGWDVAGVVERVGSKVKRFAAGDDVYAYARKPVVQGGAYAEFIALPLENVARKPKTLSFEEAATIPLSGLTAYQALFDRARLRSGDVALIHAAAGGVGGFAVQLAKTRGAVVLGTAGSRNHDYLRSLGVDEPIDYTQGDFCEAVRKTHPEGVDVVLDTLGGDTLVRSASLLKKKGRIVSLIDPEGIARLKAGGVKAHYLFVSPNARELTKIAEIIEKGLLRTTLAATFPLADAAKAQVMSATHHVRGKIVLII
ncbi:MAG: NADP-dependent oxidoreductase [Kiritimatiellae bacterium]|nr:NADP-dependent oxidoreductase [Kiritimatiellia bacterium]